jgi:hypothetical protein
VDLYIHSPTRLHGVVLNELSTGTTLPYLFRLVARKQIPNTHQWTNWEEVFSMRSVRQLL